jgi:hypothetical protein
MIQAPHDEKEAVYGTCIGAKYPMNMAKPAASLEVTSTAQLNPINRHLVPPARI